MFQHPKFVGESKVWRFHPGNTLYIALRSANTLSPPPPPILFVHIYIYIYHSVGVPISFSFRRQQSKRVAVRLLSAFRGATNTQEQCAHAWLRGRTARTFTHREREREKERERERRRRERRDTNVSRYDGATPIGFG